MSAAGKDTGIVPNEPLFVAAVLLDPSAAFALLLAGILLLYWELAAPGRVIPGIAGGVAIAVALNSIVRHPWRVDALALILAGISLILVQGATGRRLAGLLAGALLAVGVHRFSQPAIHPLLVVANLPFTAVTVFLLRTAVVARRKKRSLERGE